MIEENIKLSETPIVNPIKTVKDPRNIRVKSSRPFKLKNKFGKNIQIIRMQDFGFVPEVLILERKDSSWFVINAVLTEEEIKKEDSKLKKLKNKK